MFRVSATTAGPLFASVAMVMFSLNDVAMKVLSRVLSQILLKFEFGDRLDTITLQAPQIAETR
jgi:hypothetical protein